MAIIRNPDGTQRRAGGQIAPPTYPGGLAGGGASFGIGRPGAGYGRPAGSDTVQAAAPQQAPAYGGRPVSSAYQQWQQQEDRDHVMNGAFTPQEKASRTGETIMGPTGITFQPGKTTAISTLANGRGGGGYGGYGGGGTGANPGGGFGGGGGRIPGGALGIGVGLQDAQDEANRANEARYQEALGINAQSKQDQLGALKTGYGNVYGTINGGKSEQLGFLDKNLQAQQDLTAGFGGTAHERENRRLAGQNANTVQSLVGRGLSNSTVQDSLLKGNATDSAFIQNSIDEDVNRQRLGIQSHYGDQGLDVMGRSTAALAGAQLGEANATPDVINREDAQRIQLIASKTDEGPDVQQYLRQLNQPGAGGGGYGYGGGGPANGRQKGFGFRRPNDGGGDQGGADPLAFLQDYMQAQGYGGGGQARGGNEYVDQSTIDANRRARAQSSPRLYNNTYGYGT